MNPLKNQFMTEALALINQQAEEYQQSLDEQIRRVSEYAKLAESEDLSRALELIVDNEEAGITRTELIQAVNLALTMLFSNPLTGKVHIPLSFFQTPLGEIINNANLRYTPFLDALTLTEAAKEVNVSRQTVYNWISQGKLLPVWVRGQPFAMKPEVQIVARKAELEAKAGQKNAPAERASHS